MSPSQKYLEELQKSLYTTRSSQEQKRNYSINVHICKSITDATDLSPENFKVDYVVFLVNLVNYNCLEEVNQISVLEVSKNNFNFNKKNCFQLECHLKFLKPYFRREKICLVNPNPSYVDSVIQPEVLWEFAKFHQLNLLNGKVMVGSCFLLLGQKSFLNTIY